MKLFLHSEKIRPEGGALAQGMSRALGTPRLDNISVLVREAVQNSWDARKKRDGLASVDFNVRIDRATKSQHGTLKKEVFAELPNKHPIEAVLQSEPRVMFLEDRGTVGLGGPVFLEPGQKATGNRNFINFFRLFGRMAEVGAGGGTYGYGKAVFFNASTASTILVHTKCLEADGSTEERLMGMSLHRPAANSLDTGRHWWGVRDRKFKDAASPLMAGSAASLAADLGFTPFGKDKTGTNIMILAPRLQVPKRDRDEVGEAQQDEFEFAKCVAESLVIWFWPRMLGGTDKKGELRFSVSLDGTTVLVPDPRKTAPFNTYSLALDHLVAHLKNGAEIPAPHSLQVIASQRPAARLGTLSLVRTPVRPRTDWAVTSIDDHSMTDQLVLKDGHLGTQRHVALIRTPGQVIRYLPCREYPDGSLEYGGVFLAAEEPQDVADAFALAEPPSHDDWVPDDLVNDWHRRYVRICLREIKQKAEAFADVGRAGLVGGAQDPLGALSAQLGVLLSAPGSGPQAMQKGAGGGAGGGGGGGGGRGPAPGQLQGDGALELWDGEPAFVLPFKIQLQDGQKEAVIKAHPRVLVAGGGKESEAPEGADEPRILAWRAPDGRLVRSKSELKVREKDCGDWQVVVSVPKDAMVGVVLESSASKKPGKAD